MLEFTVFLGIDQTGAQRDQGKKAKPLKVCLATKAGVEWKVFTQDSKGRALQIENLTPSSLEKFFTQFSLPWPNPNLGILADCVFGMPESVFPISPALNPPQNLWSLFHQTKKHSHDGALFGLKVSENFFSRFLNDKTKIPVRQCEKISSSNSLFTTRPFQKNIQTGSYRIWKDLISEVETPWLNIWPFNGKTNFLSESAWLFEGYPTLYWQELLQLKNRNTPNLISKLQLPEISKVYKFDSLTHLKNDPDLCDATVLALAGIILQKKNKLFLPFPGFQNLECLKTEGWIAGLQPDTFWS